MNDLKYKEDGIVNGARGYVDSFQFDDDNDGSLKVIWIVFRDKTVGIRMRKEKFNLKGNHRTNNPDAVPIEVMKTRFEINNRNHKYVRTQFPVILAYAVTAHKSQGESLEEVTIDFTTDAKGKRPYIIAGSFYVAITRATKADNVYLKGFEKSYIKAEPRIAEKIDAMRLTKPYIFKKIYNDDSIFTNEGEVKIGFFNVNGILDAEHNVYLNNDKNLLNLDLLVIAETKLTTETSNNELKEKLWEFNLLQRFDANDGQKHMGMLVMSRKQSQFQKIDPSILNGFKDENSQGLVYGMLSPLYLSFAFIYIRPGKGSKNQINKILIDYKCEDCDVIMGDLNLNPNNAEEKVRILQLCNDNLEMALHEETTTNTFHQIDHILIHKRLRGKTFVTSYFNFTSDHKPIVGRFGIDDNTIKKEVIQNLKYSSSRFMKKNINDKVQDILKSPPYMSCDSDNEHSNEEENITLIDISSLEGNAWLTDIVINEYASILNEKFSNTFVFSTHFLTSLKNRGLKEFNAGLRKLIYLKNQRYFSQFMKTLIGMS